MEGLHGIVLAAGEGERLGGIYPKPFTPVNGVPVASRLLRSLQEFGCDHLTLVVRAQDEIIADAVVAIARLASLAWAIVPQPPMAPDDRIAAVIGDDRTARMRTIVVLGDNVYIPSLAALYCINEAPGAAETMVVAVRSTLMVHGVLHDDVHVTGRRVRAPLHDVGVYQIPKGQRLAPGPPHDRTVLGAMLESGSVELSKLAKEATWIDVGTPSDLARADLLLRAAEGACASS